MDLEFNSMFKQESSHAISKGISKGISRNFELAEMLDVNLMNDCDAIWEIESDEPPIQ